MQPPPYDDPLKGNPKYRTVKELGRGGMGAVYLAEHRMLGTKVVVKLLHAKLSERDDLVDRLRLEAQTLARLEHPNLVRVTDFGETEQGQPFFVMEYLPGRSLREAVVARGGWLPVVEAIDLVQQTLKGLSYAHQAGLVHRDLKLDNLFLCDASEQAPHGQIRILDFGVAKVLDDASDAPQPLAVPTKTGMVVGTPRFFAPEQARGHKLDARADIYSLGMVIYSMLAGRGPFDDAKTITEMAKAHVLRQPQPPSTLASQAIPPALDAVILRCIEKLPEHRYQSADELSTALATVAAAATTSNAAQAWAATDYLGNAQGAPPSAPHTAERATVPQRRFPQQQQATAALPFAPAQAHGHAFVPPTEVLVSHAGHHAGGHAQLQAGQAPAMLQGAPLPATTPPHPQGPDRWAPTLVPQAPQAPPRLLWALLGLIVLVLLAAGLILALRS